MEAVTHWLCIIRPPRPTFRFDATDDERRVMDEHFAYLQGLLREGKLLLAGPSLDPVFGIMVLAAQDEQEARDLVAADPAVRAGVQTPELHPFRVALVAGRD